MIIKASPVAARNAKRAYEAFSIPSHTRIRRDTRSATSQKTRTVSPLRISEVVDWGVGAMGRKADD